MGVSQRKKRSHKEPTPTQEPRPEWGLEKPDWLNNMLRANGTPPPAAPRHAAPQHDMLGLSAEPASETAIIDVPRSDMVECPRCGSANYDVASECDQCGWQFVRECRNCSHIIPPGATRCEHCGASVSRSGGFARVIETDSAASRAPTVKQLSGPRGGRAAREARRRRGKRRGFSTAVAALVIVVALIVLLMWPPAGDVVASVIHVNPHDVLTQLANWLNQHFSR